MVVAINKYDDLLTDTRKHASMILLFVNAIIALKSDMWWNILDYLFIYLSVRSSYECNAFFSFTHPLQHPNLNVRVKVTKRILMIAQNSIAVLQPNRVDCRHTILRADREQFIPVVRQYSEFFLSETKNSFAKI